MKVLVDFEQPRGEVKRVILDNGEEWILEGECNRCGECCEQTKMPLKDLQNKEGGCKYFSYETVNGEKLGKCEIMWYRPAFCMLYPRDPYEPLTPNCSYRWKRVK